MSREKKKRAGRILSVLYAAAVYAFIYIPIGVMFAFSFNNQSSNTHWVGFTGKYYLQLFRDWELMQVFGTTLLLAFSSAALALVIGTLGAVALCRYQFRGKGVIRYAVLIPLVVPEVVIAVALISVMSLIGFPRGFTAVLFGHVTLVLPYMILSVKTSLSDYKISIEEASLDLGANRRETFFKITLPLIMPGVMSGAFLAFTLSLDDLVITDFLAGPRVTTLPVKVYSLVKIGVSPEINALYTLIVLSIAVILAVRTIGFRGKRRKTDKGEMR